jgi:uncharacterized membrane protein YjjP (DUF1212 family)
VDADVVVPMRSIIRAPRTWGTLAVALGVGLLVAFVARNFAGGTCPTHEAFVTTSCVDLVGSLAARMGVASGLAVVFMEALAAGLLRTAWTMERDRGAADRPAV